MALSATIIWEVRFGGSDTNGGGFKPGASGTDWTLQDTAQYSVTDGVTAGTTTVTSATANFGTDVVGNVIYVQGGTGAVTAGWYEITARASTTSITVDRSTGLTAGTGVTLIIGGALATPARAAGSKVAGNGIYIKYNASSYTLTTASSNVSGGVINENTGGVDSTGQCYWTGYDTTRTVINTDANRPTILIPGAGVSTVTMFLVAALNITIRNIIMDGASKASIVGFNVQESFGGCRVINCKAMNMTGGGFLTDTYTVLIACEATGCATVGAFTSASNGGLFYACYAHDNTITGFNLTGATNIVNCISESNSGASTDGFSDITTAEGRFVNSIAYNNGRDGFRWSVAFGRNQTALNCIAYSNTGTGYNVTGANNNVQLINCAYVSNGTNVSGSILYNQGGILLSGDPFTNAAGGDFSSNAGAGAAIRALAYPVVYPNGTTSSYLDIGGIQHQEVASGGESSSVFG